MISCNFSRFFPSKPVKKFLFGEKVSIQCVLLVISFYTLHFLIVRTFIIIKLADADGNFFPFIDPSSCITIILTIPYLTRDHVYYIIIRLEFPIIAPVIFRLTPAIFIPLPITYSNLLSVNKIVGLIKHTYVSDKNKNVSIIITIINTSVVGVCLQTRGVMLNY
jgi:hypothetical protein